jgi:hypothetical protein
LPADGEAVLALGVGGEKVSFELADGDAVVAVGVGLGVAVGAAVDVVVVAVGLVVAVGVAAGAVEVAVGSAVAVRVAAVTSGEVGPVPDCPSRTLTST